MGKRDVAPSPFGDAGAEGGEEGRGDEGSNDVEGEESQESHRWWTFTWSWYLERGPLTTGKRSRRWRRRGRRSRISEGGEEVIAVVGRRRALILQRNVEYSGLAE